MSDPLKPLSDGGGPDGKPPGRPPVVEYRGAYSGGQRSLNTPWRVIGRVAVGLVIGVGGCFAGLFLAGWSGTPLLFFVPLMVALALAGWYALSQRKYGYFTGIILGPVILLYGVVLLILIICGTGAWHR